jgi:ABC-type uncharacterized transport system YnjBCD substrate-binding protein
MKKSIFTLIALLFVATLSAQTLPSAEERAKASADNLRTTLGLDSKQYAKIYKAYLKYMRREDKRRAQSATDNAATERSIKSVLSAEQVARYEQEGQKDVLTPRREPLTRVREIEPQRRDPRRTNMYIEKR